MQIVNGLKYPIPSTAVFVHNDRGEILIGKRIDEPNGNPLALPGGKIDFGESPAQAAIREVKEESGLDIEIVDQIGFSNDLFKDGDNDHYVTMYFLAKVVGGNLHLAEPHKMQEWQWIHPTKLPPLFVGCEKVLLNYIARKGEIPITPPARFTELYIKASQFGSTGEWATSQDSKDFFDILNQFDLQRYMNQRPYFRYKIARVGPRTLNSITLISDNENERIENYNFVITEPSVVVRLTSFKEDDIIGGWFLSKDYYSLHTIIMIHNPEKI